MASYLLYHLLAERPAVVDHANASRTQLWNLQTRRHLLTFPAEIRGISLSADGKLLAIRGRRDCYLCSVSPASTIASIRLEGAGRLKLSPNGRHLAIRIGTDEVKVWDTKKDCFVSFREARASNVAAASH